MGPGQFTFPAGLAVAADGSVYVVDRGNNRVQHFDADGVFLDMWGEEGTGDGQLRLPQGIAAAPDGSVYVADLRNSRVVRFGPSGEFLSSFGSIGTGDGQFAWPTDVAVAADATVYVTDSGVSNGGNNRVQRFSAEGEFLGSFGASGGRHGQFDDPQGVAVGGDGVLYVADTGNHRVQAFAAEHPESWRAEIYANRWLAERPRGIGGVDAVNEDWRGTSPHPDVPDDGFGVRFVRVITLDSGRYRFTVEVEGGVRLWVGDRLLIDQAEGLSGVRSATVPLSAGEQRVRLDYSDVDGPAAVRLTWEREGAIPISIHLPRVTRGWR